MKTIFLLLSLFLSVVCLQAQEAVQYKLWPDQEGNQSEIFVYLPSQSDTLVPVVLICPGGGYQMLAMDHEGHEMAKWFVSKGMAAVVLKYRMPYGDHTIPLSDAEKAISTIRENASNWNIDSSQVGVSGSSAGGHLAASLSTLGMDENRPDFAILFYPVISFDDKTTHGGSKQSLLGKEVANKSLVDRYSLEKQVDIKTPKTLLLLSDDDGAVPPANSILYYTALKENNIPASMYIFPLGEHGWGFNTTFTYREDVKRLMEEWLKYHEILKSELIQ